MHRHEHEQRCIEFLGAPYTEVHIFLDQMAAHVGLDLHRQYLHNPGGVEKVVREYGEEVRCAALLHLYDDYEYYQYWNDFGLLRNAADRMFD